MYDYTLIIHPTNEELLYKYEPGMKNKPRPLVKKVLEWMQPFKASEIRGLYSDLGRTAKGALVMCPLLMEQMVSLSPTKVMKAVINTLKFASSISPKLIGLTAYAAFSGNKGADLKKIIPCPMTTGSNYTLSTIPEAILRGADLMDIPLDDTYILILGGTSSVGKYCLDILSHFVRGTYVSAHNVDKLNIALAGIPKEKRAKIHSKFDINSILNKTKIIIVATNRIPAEFDISKVEPGSLIFDASYPRRILPSIRNDVLVIDGVTVKPPGDVKFNFDFGLPEGLCYPCMAEPMILALEKKFEDYSLGKDFDAFKVKEILRLGAKHGFEIDSLTSKEKPISDIEISRIKANIKKKSKSRILLWR
ncbi:MAG: hypothetical protein C4533_03400 [Candidatus Omnitrophota bacterium]|jgi:predicted amino acid dehydrogenase|nr:MAG: hypothetical protein C4533_03400 [Candidatus Omnitrophota bacterium]